MLISGLPEILMKHWWLWRQPKRFVPEAVVALGQEEVQSTVENGMDSAGESLCQAAEPTQVENVGRGHFWVVVAAGEIRQEAGMGTQRIECFYWSIK